MSSKSNQSFELASRPKKQQSSGMDEQYAPGKAVVFTSSGDNVDVPWLGRSENNKYTFTNDGKCISHQEGGTEVVFTRDPESTWYRGESIYKVPVGAGAWRGRWRFGSSFDLAAWRAGAPVCVLRLLEAPKNSWYEKFVGDLGHEILKDGTWTTSCAACNWQQCPSCGPKVFTTRGSSVDVPWLKISEVNTYTFNSNGTCTRKFGTNETVFWKDPGESTWYRGESKFGNGGRYENSFDLAAWRKAGGVKERTSRLVAAPKGSRYEKFMGDVGHEVLEAGTWRTSCAKCSWQPCPSCAKSATGKVQSLVQPTIPESLLPYDLANHTAAFLPTSVDEWRALTGDK